MPDIIFKIFIALVGVGILAIGVLIATHILWLPWLLKTLADRNFLITSVQEGTTKAIMKYGEFHRLVMSWDGHDYDNAWNVRKNADLDPDKKNPLTHHFIDDILPGGLRWIGLPFGNTIYRYHFEWSSIKQGTLDNVVKETSHGTEAVMYQSELKDLLDSRNEFPDYIILKKDVYGQTFQDTEDQEMIPLAFIALLTAQVENPYKALFHTEQWLEQILNFLRSYIKDYVGQRTFSQLTGTVQEGQKCDNLSKEQSDIILKQEAPDRTPLGEYILQKWGVRIDHLNLVNFKTAGVRGVAYEQAASIEYTEKQRAKGIRAIAEAEAYRVTTVAKAILEGGGEAQLVRVLEAYESMGENGATMILGGGNQPVQMLIESARRNPKQLPPPPTNPSRKDR